MSSENVNRHKIHKIAVHNLALEVITLGNGSQINLEELCKHGITTHGTFWIDLQFEIETVLNVKVVSMELRPVSFTQQEKRKYILHAIHRPHLEVPINLEKFEAEVEELERLASIH